ncbi:MAG: gamma-glutamyl-gamma-aminobutyrate hydrolase family protein [Candidatus Sumerlaeia bacterium]|nr:gamma-glutamyl-gamma-aminobutyrate hydrolase family protein [Candidatus Sumerlaeia bacterium]
MNCPIIGITAGRILGDGSRERRQYVWFGTGRPYAVEVARAGGAPLLLPPLADSRILRATLPRLDGLLLSGGGDIAPELFGAEPHPATNLIDPDRDCTEIEAVRWALRQGLPVLAICRGIQVLNVALGGDLIQDIPTQVANAVRHSGADLTACLSHSICVEKDSLLASLIGAGRVLVNSSHHQAAGRVGRGLRVTATAPDGVIEALESDRGAPVLAVQFHPEDVAGEHPRFRALFQWLVEAARRFRRRR